MKKLLQMFIIFYVSIIFSGCSGDSWVTKNKTQDSLKKTIETLQFHKERIESIEYENRSLINLIETVSDRTSLFQNTIAIFTPSSKDSITINTPAGNFFVSLRDLTKYADGYKATFYIGNPNYATFDNLEVNVAWPIIKKDGKSDYITINKPILPGIWNKVSIILSPATSSEIGVISLMIKPGQVVLKQDYRIEIN